MLILIYCNTVKAFYANQVEKTGKELYYYLEISFTNSYPNFKPVITNIYGISVRIP